MKRSTLPLHYFMPPKTQTITITLTLEQRIARARFDQTFAIVDALFNLNHYDGGLSFRARRYGKMYRFRFTDDCNKIIMNSEKMSRERFRVFLHSLNDPCFNSKLIKLANKTVNDKKSQFKPPAPQPKYFDCADFFNFI
jgi:hypothetical protein